jgi:RyR domain
LFVPYQPKPIDTTKVQLPVELTELIERLAENTHDTWASLRLAEGWTYGPHRDDEGKRHPGLVVYADLTEAEKEYDRATAVQAIKAVVALGYRIEGGVLPVE